MAQHPTVTTTTTTTVTTGTGAGGAVSGNPALGVVTTTPVAFLLRGELHLERMNMISEEGAGVLCPFVPEVGDELSIAFRLSTSEVTLRCHAQVVGGAPTTPAGITLRREKGEAQYKAVMSEASRESATSIVRIADLQPSPKTKAQTPGENAAKQSGFALRFVDLSAAGRQQVARHIRISRRISDQMAAHGGALVELEEDERPTLSSFFDEGDLSRKALDW
jgi:hypothetical protein